MRHAVGLILALLWMAMVAVAVIAIIRGHIDWLRLHTRRAGALLLVVSLPVAVIAGLIFPKVDDTKTAAPHTLSPSTTVATTAAATTSPAATSPTTAEPPDTSLEPDSNEVSCSQVGGVFVPHGTDGRGDCEPADRRPHCHVPPAEQDGNYAADLIMSPPFPNGTINLVITRLELAGASNADCWKLPGA